MANLAIRGHETRGEEVIRILEMLGGKNGFHREGNNKDMFYYIDRNDYIQITCGNLSYTLFNLEEFLEKFPYKVGDKVMTDDGDITNVVGMIWDNDINDVFYEIQICNEIFKYPKELLQPYKEETMKETNKAVFEGNAQCCDIMNDIIKDNIEERKYAELRMPLDDDDKLSTEVTIDGNKITPPENYLIGKVTQVDNGMLVEFVKKQPNYPKTYVECCEILNIPVYGDIVYTGNWVYGGEYLDKHLDVIRSFHKLKICRDAYLKIAGEQMGLDKPWEPDLIEMSHAIVCRDDGVFLLHRRTRSILAFPTKEMRDAFYENFKELIEECKEFL